MHISGFLRFYVLRACFLGVIGACVLGACAPVWQKPQVRLVQVRMAGGSLFQQKLKLQLLVQNPNGMDIGLESLNFDLLIGEERFARGQSNNPVTIPKQGEAHVEVEAQAQLLSLLSRVSELATADGKLQYRLKGEARISHYGRAPFDQPGELDLNSLSGLSKLRAPLE